MPFDGIILVICKLARLLDNAVGNLGLANIVEKTADGCILNFFFAEPQPSCEYITDQGNIHTMDIGGVIIFPHAMQHVKDVRTCPGGIQDI